MPIPCKNQCGRVLVKKRNGRKLNKALRISNPKVALETRIRFMIIKIIKAAVGIGLIALGVIFSNIIPAEKSDYRKSESELISLTSHLSNPPIYLQQPGVKTGGKYALRLDLVDYPGIHFDNDNEFLDATDFKTFLADAKFKDKVTIKVSKEDFSKYYLNRDSLSTFQKFAHPQDDFSFFSLVFDNKEYVGDIYSAEKKRRNDNLYFHFFLGLLCVLGGLYFIFNKK